MCLVTHIFATASLWSRGKLLYSSQQFAELGAHLQNNVPSRACASFSNGVASRAITYFSTKKIRIISLSCHRVSDQENYVALFLRL